MGIRIENGFSVPSGIKEIWRIVNDVPRIVPCMPGTELTEVVGNGIYRGNVKVKIGPMQLQFVGEAQLYDIDPLAHTIKMRSRASDAKGRGNVAAEMSFILAEDGGCTRIDFITDLTLTGSVAQYGRGAGLIKDLANEITRKFAANLEELLRRDAAGAAKDSAASAQAPRAATPVSAFSLLFAAARAALLRLLG